MAERQRAERQRGVITVAVAFVILAASFVATHSAVMLGEAIRATEQKDCTERTGL